MKKIIESFLLMLFSIFNNVDYVASPPQVFTNSSYYKGDVSTDGVAFKELYESYYSNLQDLDGCDGTPYDAKNTLTIPSIVSGYYWFIPGQEYSENTKLAFKEGQEIVAPCNVVIATSSSASSNSTYMEVTTAGELYQIRISNMKCWYCCAKKNKPKNGIYTHTGADLKGTTIPAGKVLGVATKDTKIQIYQKSGSVYTSPVKVKTFYNIK